MASEVQFPVSFATDPESGDIQTDSGGRLVRCSGEEAYRRWALNTLQTARYRHPVYSRGHGTEVEAMLRQNLQASVLYSEIARTYTEALMVDPRTESVGDFSFTRAGSDLAVACVVRTRQGQQIPLSLSVRG